MPLHDQISYGLESVAGVPVATTAFIPLVSESLTKERERLESEGIIPGRRVLAPGQRNGGPTTISGDTSHELYNRGSGKLFTAWLGTPVTSSLGGGRYSHVWTPGAPKPCTIQKGVTANDGTVWPIVYTGMMAGSWEIACSQGEIATQGTTWAGMDEIAMRTFADAATTAASAVLTSATAGFSIEDVGSPISGTGIPAATTILSVQSATSITLSANATATGMGVTITLGSTLAAASYPAGLKPYKFNHGSVTIDGTAVKVKQITLSGDNGLDTDRRFLGQEGIDVPLEVGLHVYEGSLEAEFASPALYNKFLTGVTGAVVLAFSNLGGDSLTFAMTAQIDPETPTAGGRDLASQNLPFKLVGDTDAAALTVTMVNADATV